MKKYARASTVRFIAVVCLCVFQGCAGSNVSTRGSAGAHFATAQTLALQGDCVHAIPEYRFALSDDPRFVRAISGIADCYESTGDYRDAESEYDNAIKIDPKDYTLYQRRSNTEASEGNLSSADSDAELALQTAPQEIGAYTAIAGSFAGAHDFDAAIGAIGRALRMAPSRPDLLTQQGRYYQAADRQLEARRDFESAIAHASSPRDKSAAYFAAAQLALQEDRLNQGVSYIHAAIALDPTNGDFFATLGSLDMALERWSAAANDFATAIRHYPPGSSRQNAQLLMGDAYVKMGQVRAATRQYDLVERTGVPEMQSAAKARVQTLSHS